MSSFWFRTASLAATLAVSAVSGTYYLVRLAHECAGVEFVSCIQKSLLPAPSEPPKVVTETPTKAPKNAPAKAGPGPATAPQSAPQHPQQEAGIEAMLIWTGHLDGEVGRVAKGDFEKAVRAFQTSLNPAGVGSELTDQQRKTLRTRSDSARSAWEFRRVSDPLTADLWLPMKLLPDSKSLRFGRRYASANGEFSVDVAQFSGPEWTLERLRELHCCKISPTRKLEGAIVDRSDAGMPGFVLNAVDGKERISVRAFQKENVIRLLAITSNIDRDEEFRRLRNAIASSYIPFGPASKEERSASCSNAESDGEACNDKPSRNVWQRIVHEP
jgi:hypothetical protein